MALLLDVLKKCWNFVKNDVVKFMQEFNEHGRLPKAYNPQCTEEFRPSCLVVYLYRLISKLQAYRLKLMIGKLVSSSQMEFIESRQMVDNVLVLNETLDISKRNKKNFLAMEVDFEKAFHCVSWGFLRYVLKMMGFGQKWLF
ncbi:uncharacterized protein LOC131632926 [Vicia villosa]|uniref:uncharacterized protein LOC131632926 n=1 Tax=Vicia villosa TaxID=3911 RepID=UPI00273C3013|nr:uncharacterized protein LOC131632926 [Vicia villosa]